MRQITVNYDLKEVLTDKRFLSFTSWMLGNKLRSRSVFMLLLRLIREDKRYSFAELRKILPFGISKLHILLQHCKKAGLISTRETPSDDNPFNDRRVSSYALNKMSHKVALIISVLFIIDNQTRTKIKKKKEKIGKPIELDKHDMRQLWI